MLVYNLPQTGAIFNRFGGIMLITNSESITLKARMAQAFVLRVACDLRVIAIKIAKKQIAKLKNCQE